jgi:hypothetical protein
MKTIGIETMWAFDVSIAKAQELWDIKILLFKV